MKNLGKPMLGASDAVMTTARPNIIDVDYEEVASLPKAFALHAKNRASCQNGVMERTKKYGMNRYRMQTDSLGGATGLNTYDLKCIFAAWKWGNLQYTFFSGATDGADFELPFVIDSSGLMNMLDGSIVSTEITANLLTLGKQVIQRGDIVVLAYVSGGNPPLAYYESYVKLSDIARTDAPSYIDVYIGISNTSTSDFETPFDEGDAGQFSRLVISPRQVETFV